MKALISTDKEPMLRRRMHDLLLFKNPMLRKKQLKHVLYFGTETKRTEFRSSLLGSLADEILLLDICPASPIPLLTVLHKLKEHPRRACLHGWTPNPSASTKVLWTMDRALCFLRSWSQTYFLLTGVARKSDSPPPPYSNVQLCITPSL